MPTLERILAAAVPSMIHGHHAPHCYSAWIKGQGYVNKGGPEHDRADYLRQLERTAQAEIENMTYAPGYAEPYRDDPIPKAVLLANWNNLPENFDRTLEKAGYAVEWSDEWTTCEDCQRAIRTEPDSHWYKPHYQIIEEDRSAAVLCLDCLQDYAGTAADHEPEPPDDDQADQEEPTP